MAYPTYPYQGYQPMYYPQPVPDQLTQLRQNQMQPQMMQAPQMPAQGQQPSIIWVQGEEGAKAYMVAAGNSVMLMDSDDSIFYIKTADASGVPQPLRIFDYAERAAASRPPVQTIAQPDVEYVTRAEFDALAARMEALTAKEPKQKKTTKEEADNG